MTKQQPQTWGWQRIFNAGLLTTTYLLGTTTKKFSSSVGSIAITSWAGLSVLQSVNADNSVNLQAGLVAYYPFNGNANDESGNGLDGTVYGATLTTDRFGNANKAYSFDGISNYIKIGAPVPSPLQIQNSISLSAWIYVTSVPHGVLLWPIVGSIYNIGHLSGVSIFLDARNSPGGQPSPVNHIHFQIGDGNWHGTNVNSVINMGAADLKRQFFVIKTKKTHKIY